jgi:hypothetical protein
MFNSIKYKLLITIVMASLLITACGPESTAEATQELNSIETAVAETVAAQNTAQSSNTSTPVAPVVTKTPLMFSPTLTPLASIASPTLPANTTKSKCASASLVSETIPDGTIFKPGEQFTKTWEIQNTSTCSWDTNYKIVFWDGDVLGGAYVYNLPQAVDPGQTFPISLLMIAPAAEATYTSKWMLQTPDSIEFGVGQYNAPFYTEIAVSSSSSPNYGVTSVDYTLVQDPPTGCPANINYIVYATVATSGPIEEFTYFWNQSDGNASAQKTVNIKSATTTTLSHEWKLHIATNVGTRWMSLVVVQPVYREYPRVEFTKTCGG